MKPLLIIFSLLISSFVLAQTKLITPQEFKIRIDTTTSYQIIDIRKPSEYARGYLKGAININYYDKDFKEQIARLDKSIPTFVYCHIAGRSGHSMKIFKSLGFKDVYDMNKGIVGWKKLNYPLIYPQQKSHSK